MYYLEKAPHFKQLLTEQNFTEAQINTILEMMGACKVLRQFSVIQNLVRESLPEGFDLVGGQVIDNRSACPKCNEKNTEKKEGFLNCRTCNIKIQLEGEIV